MSIQQGLSIRVGFSRFGQSADWFSGIEVIRFMPTCITFRRSPITSGYARTSPSPVAAAKNLKKLTSVKARRAEPAEDDISCRICMPKDNAKSLGSEGKA